jgi:CheY-like chemotaxis protein
MVMNKRALDRAEVLFNTRVRTLVVDDSPFMLKILAQILEEAGNFDLVGTATNGCQALRYVSMLSPELVLMDVHMPRLNGIQATRYIKQREHPPAIIIVTSDDSAITKATAEEAGADAFVSKDGNLRQQLMDVLQDLFGPNGARRAKKSNTVNETRRSPNMASENGLGNFATHERFDSALGIFPIQATDPGNATAPFGTPSLGSAQRPQPRSPRCIQHTVGRSPRPPVAGTRHPFAQLCASLRIQPARKAGTKTYDTMKTRRRLGNIAQEKAEMTPGVPPTIEEIRPRAHEIFMARGGTPGNELDDWLRAEQELKRERAGTNTDTT